MKEIYGRFIFLFHWAGFICLATLTAVCVFDVFVESGRLFEDVIEILMLEHWRSSNDLRGSASMLWIWLAVTHYPIKWILTGNKTFFPWK